MLTANNDYASCECFNLDKTDDINSNINQLTVRCEKTYTSSRGGCAFSSVSTSSVQSYTSRHSFIDRVLESLCGFARATYEV